MATEATPKRTRDLGILALVVLGPVWGYGWVATKVALDFSDALTFAALRVPLSAALLFLAMLVARRPLRPPPLGWTMLVGLLQTTLFMGLVLTALHDTGAGRVSVLTYTMPFWLLLLAWAFLGERLRGAQWLAVTLAFTGLVLVVRPWAFDGVVSGVLTVLGGASWAASALVVKLLQRRHTVDVLSLTAWQMLLGSIPLVLAAALVYDGGPQWTLTFWWGLAYTCLLYTSDAADDLLCVDLGGRRIIKKKNTKSHTQNMPTTHTSSSTDKSTSITTATRHRLRSQ